MLLFDNQERCGKRRGMNQIVTIYSLFASSLVGSVWHHHEA